jgi:hypothetical protein
VATDTQAMTLLIRLMPLMQREFSLRVDPGSFFADSGYREAILGSALGAAEPRLRSYAEQLRARLVELGKGTPGVVRSAANTGVDFDRTSPSPLGAHPSAAPASGEAPPPAPEPPTPPDPVARKYIGRLR